MLQNAKGDNARMNLLKNTLTIGLPRPLRLLHVTDTHLCLADERDCERKRVLARARLEAFRLPEGAAEAQLCAMIEYANERDETVVHTGDLIDFVSVKNLEVGRACLDRARDCFFVAGNHEYSQYVGEAWEDTAYRMNSYRQVREGLGVDLLFSARQVGGVNLVGVDNGYYQFEPWQLTRLQMEVKKGLPILLCLHNPLYAPDLYDFSMVHHHGVSAYLVGCDEEHLLPFQEYRAVQQRPTPDTLRFIDYVLGERAIRAVLAGHLHASFEGTLPNGVPQLVTAGTYQDTARELTLL